MTVGCGSDERLLEEDFPSPRISAMGMLGFGGGGEGRWGFVARWSSVALGDGLGLERICRGVRPFSARSMVSWMRS